MGRVEGPEAGLGGVLRRSLDPPSSPPSLSCPLRWQPAHQEAQRKGRHQVAVLGLCSIVAVGQRRQGLKAAPPPCTRLGLHVPLLFIFTQNVFGFFRIPQRALSIFFLQPLPVLEKLKTKLKMSHTHLHPCRL